MSQTKNTVGLQRSLTLKDMIIYGMIFMIPIAPMGIYGYIVTEAKGMATLAYFVGMVAMVFTAMSYARMADVCPRSGSVYAYASHAIGQRVGFLIGWLVLLDYILLPALCYVVAALALEGVTGIAKWTWLLAFIVFNTMINIRGINVTARVNNIFVLLQLAILVWFVALGLDLVFHGSVGAVSVNSVFDRSTFSLGAVMSAASIAALSFLGFDAISTLAEENSGKTRDVGRATVLVLFVMGALFILQTWVAAMVWPNFATLAADKDNAFYAVANVVGGPTLKAACAVATSVSWGFSCALVAQTAIARILLCMARDNQLPLALSRLHPRYQTPYISTVFVAIVSLIISVAFMSKVDFLTSLVNFGALSAFFVLHLCVINQFILRQPSKRWIRDGMVPLVGMAIVGYVWISLDAHAMEVGLGWLILGILYQALAGRKNRALPQVM